jgi:hypothetical protein
MVDQLLSERSISNGDRKSELVTNGRDLKSGPYRWPDLFGPLAG